MVFTSWPLHSQNLGQSHYFRTELGNLLAKPIYTIEIELTGIGVSFKDPYTQFIFSFHVYTFCEITMTFHFADTRSHVHASWLWTVVWASWRGSSRPSSLRCRPEGECSTHSQSSVRLAKSQYNYCICIVTLLHICGCYLYFDAQSSKILWLSPAGQPGVAQVPLGCSAFGGNYSKKVGDCDDYSNTRSHTEDQEGHTDFV